MKVLNNCMECSLPFILTEWKWRDVYGCKMKQNQSGLFHIHRFNVIIFKQGIITSADVRYLGCISVNRRNRLFAI